MRTTATRLQHLLTSFPSRHSEIGDFDILLLVQQQVFRFQVSVADVETMAVVYRVNDLLEVVQSFGFR